MRRLNKPGPTVMLTTKQIKEEKLTRKFRRANVHPVPSGGYTISLLASDFVVPVLLKDAGELKSWRNADVAVEYIQTHFTNVSSIHFNFWSKN